MPDSQHPSTPSRKGWLGAALLLAGGLVLWGAFVLLRSMFPGQPTEMAEALKLLVDTEAIYRITARDLAANGWAEADPADLRMEYLGQPYPLQITGEGRDLQVIFYGRPPEGDAARFSSANAYFLFRDGNRERRATLAEAEPPAGPVGPAATGFDEILHLEHNQRYEPVSVENNTWYWEQLIAPGSTGIDFEITGLAPGAGSLRIALLAVTQSPQADPDHHIRVSLNGTPAADDSWDGQGGHVLEAPLDAGLLVEGKNLLTIEAVGDTGVPADIVLLDFIEVSYTRQLQADGDRLLYTVAESEAAGLGGFSDAPLVLDVSDPQAPVIVPASDSQPDGGVYPARSDGRYAAAGPDGFARPLSILPAQRIPDLWASEQEGADYLAIGPASLLEPLEPLLAYRGEQGLSPMAVPWEALVDQFGYGLETPEAIRRFLGYAEENWPLPPRFVLLVGDWTSDPLGYSSDPPQARLPSFFRYTEYGGETVSDVEIVKLDSDLRPDLALGRVPARTEEQVGIFVEKTLRYEQNPPAGWEQRILAIADGQEPSFKGDAERFLGHFSDAFQGVLLAPPGGDTQVHLEIESRLNDGVLLMSYFGHGSIGQLGKDAIFTHEHAAALANTGHLPVMINITCLAGLFSHPTSESLSETMLWNPVGGAVAALGATSLTRSPDQAYLSQALVENLLADPQARLGEVLLRAQRSLPVDEFDGVLEVMDTFLLFGDPALQLPRP